MFGRLLRVLIGFVLACLAAGLTLVLFVMTPAEISGLPPDVASDRVLKGGELALMVAAQAALFAAPFALVAAAVGEALRNRNLVYYVLAGLIIAGLGFFAQHSTEQLGQPTIVNNYALTAFMTSGFVGGLLYWLISGRHAGGRHDAMGHPSGGHDGAGRPMVSSSAKPVTTGARAPLAKDNKPAESGRPAGGSGSVQPKKA